MSITSLTDEGLTGGKVTLAMLAAEAGVSLSTISKVLNGHADVSSETRQRVEHLLGAHGYRRRGTAHRESTLLELVFHDMTSPWAMEVLQGVQSVASEQGLSVVLTANEGSHVPGPEWLSGVLRRRPTGVVLVSSELAPLLRERLTARAIPLAVVDPIGDPVPGLPSVGSTNWAGGLSATRHLIELGHRSIAAITGPDDQLCSHARIDGYRSALRSAGLPVREDWIVQGDFEATGGARAAELLLSGADRPTAVFAGNDVQAVALIAGAERRGLRVPQDLSVVGYDDLPPAVWSRPQLTTVHQPIRRMAEEAARTVLRLAAGEAVPQQQIELATHLVVRASTAPPADARG